jgi:hypothetical protein
MWLVIMAAAAASEEGIVGHAWEGCADCHGTSPDPAVTTTLSAEATTVAGGATVAVELTVGSSELSHVQAGLNVAAEDGALAPSATLLFRDHELTHQFPHPLTDGAITFSMAWTAPAYAGTFTLSAAGNAVDGLSTEGGDGWSLDTLEMTVSSDCLDGDGDRVGDCEGDCDDTDASVHPGAEEIWYDGTDSDCGGDDDDDADQDGLPVDEDCDDTDPDVGTCEEDSGGAEPVGVPPERGCHTAGAQWGWAMWGLIGLWGRRRLQ